MSDAQETPERTPLQEVIGACGDMSMTGEKLRPLLDRLMRQARQADAVKYVLPVVERLAELQAQYDEAAAKMFAYRHPLSQEPSTWGLFHARRPLKTELERLAPLLEAEATGNRIKLPTVGPQDRQAWQLSSFCGKTQKEIAEILTREHGSTFTQGKVSRMIARAKKHAEASGLADPFPRKAKPAITMDPHQIDTGQRTDSAAHHIRAKAEQRARDKGEN